MSHDSARYPAGLRREPPVAARPSGGEARSRRTLAVLLMGGFLTVFDLFVVNVAIPSLKAGLGATIGEAGFVIAGYELGFGVLLIAGARLGDRHGWRRVYSFGVLAFSATSLLCGVAPDAPFLIAARVLQGGAAAILFPQIYALLRALPDETGRRRAFGLLGMTLGLAAIAGQVLGGLLVGADLFGLGWRSAFLINPPLGLMVMVLARPIPNQRSRTTRPIDWTGVALAALGLFLLMAALLEGPAHHWPLWSLICCPAAGLLLCAFVGWEHRIVRRGGDPAIDPGLFHGAAFSAGIAVVLLVYSAASSLFLGFALMIQNGFGLAPFAAGLLFAPASVGFVIASVAAPGLRVRFGSAALVAGPLLYAAGIAGLIVTAFRLSHGSVTGAGTGDSGGCAMFLPPLILFGFGQGLSMTPLLNLVIGSVDCRRAGMVAGIVSTAQQLGGALGICVTSLFFAHVLASPGNGPAAAGYAGAFGGAMLFNLAAVLAAAILIRRMTKGRPV